MRYAFFVAAAICSACATTASSMPAPAAGPRPAEAGTHRGPSFIEDDFSRALAQAKAENKPLFVDAWAPW